MPIERFHYPTREEIDSLMRAARRDRATAIARLFRAAGRGLSESIARGLPVDAGARARQHMSSFEISPAKEHTMAESFWKAAAASLPPRIQWRYAGLFEAAEKFERLLDFVLSARGRAHRALASGCRGLADALRNAAWALDVAARRLTPTR